MLTARCNKPRLVPKDILNIEGALYFCTFFMGIVNSLAVQPVLAAGRVVFARERAARMYSCIPYALSLVRSLPRNQISKYNNNLSISKINYILTGWPARRQLTTCAAAAVSCWHDTCVMASV